MHADDLLPMLRCPDCTGTLDMPAANQIRCGDCGTVFPVVEGRAVLLRHDNPLFSRADYLRLRHGAPVRWRGLDRLIPGPSVNLASTRVLGDLKTRLATAGGARILVVGGGRQRAWLDPLLGAGENRVVYTDIDLHADVDVFCDGHDLPFADASFDAVVTTAVLEHVLDAPRVAGEIGRVLRTGGLLYSEMPFMQQVHEGAYDFTRYTLGGHRRLFRQFTEVEAGMVAGPATALVWALENFALAFASRAAIRRLAKAGVRIAFGWIKHFDRLLAHRPEAMDGASCTFFYGMRSEQTVPDADIVRRYVGAKAISHV